MFDELGTMYSVLYVLGCASSVLAMAMDGVGVMYTDKGCAAVMENNGFHVPSHPFYAVDNGNPSFGWAVAHGIHSITLEEVRYFFDQDAPVQNKIPVANTNLSSKQLILFDAPRAGYDKDFQTMALKIMAYYMLHDAPDNTAVGGNWLEKVTHKYHMHEIYVRASVLYKQMKESPPQDPKLCPCINDVSGNGILMELVNKSAEYRYRYNKKELDKKETSHKPNKNQTALIKKYEQAYLNNSSKENMEKLINLKPFKVNTLVGPEQWISYEAMLKMAMLDDRQMRDFATFMYCRLNEQLDHPKDLFD